jgi:hypothetical protein
VIETILSYEGHTRILGPDAVVERCGYFTTLQRISDSSPCDPVEGERETLALETASYIDHNVESTNFRGEFRARRRAGRYGNRGGRRGRTNNTRGRGRGRGDQTFNSVANSDGQLRHWEEQAFGPDEINIEQVRQERGRGGSKFYTGEDVDARETVGQTATARGFPHHSYLPGPSCYDASNMHVNPQGDSNYVARGSRYPRKVQGGVRRPMRGNFVSMENLNAVPKWGAEEQNVCMPPGRGRGNWTRQYSGRHTVDIPDLMALDLDATAAGFSRRRDSQNSSTGLSSSKIKFSREVQVKNEVESEKCSLLIFLMSELRQHQCRVFVNASSHTVLVSGFNEENVAKTEELILMKLVSFHTVPLTRLSANFQKRLSSRNGRSWIRELFKKNNLRVVFFANADQSAIMADSVESADAGCELLNREIRTVCVPYSEMHQPLLKSADWNTFKSAIEKNYMVSVENPYRARDCGQS